MRHKSESGPYEHTCPECGLYQEVFEYEENPRFAVSDWEMETPTRVHFEVSVDIDRTFHCMECTFEKELEEKTLGVVLDDSVLVDGIKRMTEARLERKILFTVRIKYDVEDYI